MDGSPLLLNEALTSSKGSSAPLSTQRHTAYLESRDHGITGVGKGPETIKSNNSHH